MTGAFFAIWGIGAFLFLTSFFVGGRAPSDSCYSLAW